MSSPEEQIPEIIGYVEPWIANPGETIDVKVSSTFPQYSYQLVRLIQGVSLPRAPPLRKEVISSIPASTSRGRPQRTQPGSYAVVGAWASDDELAIGSGVAVECYAQSWLPQAEHAQTLFSTLDGASKTGFAVAVAANGQLCARVGTGDGVEVVHSGVTALRRRRWVRVRLELRGARVVLAVTHLNKALEKAPPATRVEQTLDKPAAVRAAAPFVLGARSAGGDGEMGDFFNGRLDAPVVTLLRRDGDAAWPRELARWDFARDMASDRIVDVSGNGRHGCLVNAPTRAVRGHDWDGSEPDWTKAEYGYGAIHFHDDDLDDAGWTTDFRLAIPPDALSGAYAVELWDPATDVRDSAVFFVRPAPDSSSSSTAKVAIVLSTFTYLAYANERGYDETKQTYLHLPGASSNSKDVNHARLRRHPELGLSLYDEHTDGSGAVFSSARRPILNLRPGYVMWAFDRPRELSADLLAVGFLEERLGRGAYEVVTDHDLHARGAAAVARYRVLLTGSHPEYQTLETQDAWAGFARQGGSIMYLGGNGFYLTRKTHDQWAAALAPPRAHYHHRLEVRRGDQGCRTFGLPAGETVHASTGTKGELWRSRGRAPQELLGVGSCACGTGPGVPYAPAAAALLPEFAWLWDGISAGDLGLIGVEGFGGGASGDEIDRADEELGTPEGAVVLATSLRHGDSFGLFNEEQMWPMVDTMGSKCERVRSDIVWYETAAGGAVFSVGSINWYCSLGWDAYRNNCAKVTENVLREILRRSERLNEGD